MPFLLLSISISCLKVVYIRLGVPLQVLATFTFVQGTKLMQCSQGKHCVLVGSHDYHQSLPNQIQTCLTA